MSTHEVKVVKINTILPHDNAESLELVKVWDYICVVRKGQFKIGDLAVYIEPDYVVKTSRPEFSFLAKKIQKEDGTEEVIHTNKRITVMRLRGVWSQGLLLPAPKESKEGDNLIEYLEISRWEPSNNTNFGGKSGLGQSYSVKGPTFDIPKYDLENLKKYSNVLQPEEEVIVTVKIHGTNSRWVYSNGQMYCGSRTMWKKEPGYYFSNPKSTFQQFIVKLFKLLFRYNSERVFKFLTTFPIRFFRKYTQKIVYKVGTNAWWEALKQNQWIEEWCKQNPEIVLYAEIFGPSIQGANFHYGLKEKQLGVRVFDILENGKWISNQDFYKEKYKGLLFVPVIYTGPYNISIVEKLAEQKEDFNNANHVREGLVIKVINERINPEIGRVALKYVSNTYLLKS